MLGGFVSSHLMPVVQGVLGRIKRLLNSGTLTVILANGNSTVPSVAFVGAVRSGLFLGVGGSPGIADGGAQTVTFGGGNAGVGIYSTGSFSWFSGASVAGTPDTSLNRDAADTVGQRRTTNAQKFSVYNTFASATSYERLTADWQASANVCLVGTEKGSGGGTLRPMWTISEGGKKSVTADATNATATMANLTDISITLLAGRKYTGRIVIKCINSTAAEGIQFDFNGGAATMTSFWAAAGVLASSGTDTVGANISTSLAGVINFTTLTGETVLVFELSMVVNAGGTFIMRFAENTTVVGTATVRLGSFTQLEDSI